MQTDDTTGTSSTAVTGTPDGGVAVETTDEESPSIAPETVFEVLSNERRRHVLDYLKHRDERVTVRDLSEQVAALENGIERREVTPKERKRVYTALHQTHLPKMHELGVVAYDPDRKTVSACPEAGHLGRYMDVTTRLGVTWGEYYRALGVVGLFATVASLASAPGFAGVDPLIPATGSLGAFAASTVYQLLAARLGARGRLARLRGRLF